MLWLDIYIIDIYMHDMIYIYNMPFLWSFMNDELQINCLDMCIWIDTCVYKILFWMNVSD